MTEKKQRSCNLDVIRIFAFFCVVSVHFFKDSDFYRVHVVTPLLLPGIAMRNFFMICVPLFMLLSGYLLKEKTLSKRYYCKLFQTLGIYLLASMACAAAQFLFERESFSVKAAFLGLFSYSTASYSWYVEMYIGLFLLIPFLNKIYRGESRRVRQILILTLLVLTSLPTAMNIWRLTDLSWWFRPGSSLEYSQLVPEFWVVLYPVTYYFIGAYLRDYPLQMKRWVNLLWIVVVFVVEGLFSYYRTYGEKFFGGAWTSYQSPFATVQAVLVFSFLNGLDLSRAGERTRKLLSKLSSWVLGAYLCSSIFDGLFYPKLNAAVPAIGKRIVYYPVMVLASAVCAMALSAVLNGIYSLCENFVKKGIARRREKIAPTGK